MDAVEARIDAEAAGLGAVRIGSMAKADALRLFALGGEESSGKLQMLEMAGDG